MVRRWARRFYPPGSPGSDEAVQQAGMDDPVEEIAGINEL
jgi:hypothetical protein